MRQLRLLYQKFRKSGSFWQHYDFSIFHQKVLSKQIPFASRRNKKHKLSCTISICPILTAHQLQFTTGTILLLIMHHPAICLFFSCKCTAGRFQSSSTPVCAWRCSIVTKGAGAVPSSTNSAQSNLLFLRQLSPISPLSC